MELYVVLKTSQLHSRYHLWLDIVYREQTVNDSMVPRRLLIRQPLAVGRPQSPITVSPAQLVSDHASSEVGKQGPRRSFTLQKHAKITVLIGKLLLEEAC